MPVFFPLRGEWSGCWLAAKLKCITMISTRRKAFWNCSNSIAVVIKLMDEESVHSVSSVLFGEFQWNFGRFIFFINSHSPLGSTVFYFVVGKGKKAEEKMKQFADIFSLRCHHKQERLIKS